VSLDPEPPDPSESLVNEAAVAGVVAVHAAEKPGHHGPFHTHCENCGTALSGPYCHHCGQHDFEFHRSFRHVFLEALESFFHFEGKFFRNIVTLLFSPGRLTADFNAGKRAAQMPPFRLYIFVSILFFFISFVGSHPASDLQLDENTSPRQREAVLQAVGGAVQKVRAQAESAAQRLQAAAGGPGAKPPEPLQTGHDSTLAGPAEKISPEPAAGREDTELERFLNEKGRYAVSHQAELVEAFIHALPKMLLFSLPFFALITRVLFRKSGQVYLQHLVLALHFHTFIFIWVLCRNGWGFLAGFAGPGLQGWLTFFCNAWLTLYPLLMLRRLFANSWKKTFVKTVLLFLAYTGTLGCAFVVTALIIFVLL
jgi:hypothetical protein